jgi:putative holliday junction resolvase
VQEGEVDRIVVGLPLNLAGDETPWSLEVREFAEKLGRRTGLEVHLVDERLTSVQATSAVRGSGLRRSQREEKGRVDAAAAAILLQRYLERERSRSDGSAS